jgi:hypothetical protein
VSGGHSRSPPHRIIAVAQRDGAARRHPGETHSLGRSSRGLYRPAPGGLGLEFGCESGGGARFDRVVLVECDDRVGIGVVVQAMSGRRRLGLC